MADWYPHSIEELLEILAEYENQKTGAVELASRVEESSKFAPFGNLHINLEKLKSDLANSTTLLNQTGRILKLQGLGLAMNGLNLCATCAGFAIMYKKLDAMNEEITQQLGQLQKQMQKEHTTWTGYEFRKIAADYSDMLDCRKKQKPYSEEDMRELVDQEYNMLEMLLDISKNGVDGNHRVTIDAIFSLLAMYNQTLMFFDEVYYFNNREVLQGGEVWHGSHVKWESVYDELTSSWFEKFLQDYATFETDLDTKGVDVFCLSLEEQVTDLKENLLSNQELIAAMDSQEDLNKLRTAVDQKIRLELEENVRESFDGTDNPELLAARDELLHAISIA